MPRNGENNKGRRDKKEGCADDDADATFFSVIELPISDRIAGTTSQRELLAPAFLWLEIPLSPDL